MWKDSETRIDFLDFDYLKEILKEIVSNEKLTPSTIGVYGDWGSGKSSLIEMVIEELEEDEKVLCIKFNGWLFEGYEDAKTSFMGVILDEISKKKNVETKLKNALNQLYKNIDFLKLASFGIKHGANYFLTGGVGTVISTIGEQLKKTVTGVSEGEISKVLENTFSPQNLRKSISEFRIEFENFLKEVEIKKLIVFIDELDRCNSETILETFEAMRLFLFTEKTSFIIGADERHIENAVRQKFSEIEENNITIGKEYLEKIIQYPVKIPQLGKREMINYIVCLFLQENLTESEFNEFSQVLKDNKKQLEFEIDYNFIEKYYLKILDKVREPIYLAKTLGPILAEGLNGNPRHCKRFLNALSMREKMGKYKGITLDRNILGKLMILEYFNRSYFKEFPNLLDEEGKIKELAFFERENNTYEMSLEKLDKYREDIEFKKWAILNPPISEIDLKPYLYFSRDALSNFGTLNYRLSELGKKILDDILSGTQIKEKIGLDELNKITVSEADYIYNEIIKTVTVDGKTINLEKFQILLKYCVIRKEKKDNFIKFLQAIPADKISFGMIPKIVDYFESENLREIGDDILNNWKDKNKKLSKAIEKQQEKYKGRK